MQLERSSGVLLHATSLPGEYGIGEFGPAALQFLEFLQAAGQGVWQLLPLGPTGYGDSPYQSYSAFAGNPLLISTDRLIEEGFVSPLTRPVSAPAAAVDYAAVNRFKMTLLRSAYERSGLTDEVREFAGENAWWLDDYALFMALTDHLDGQPWNRWEPGLAARKPPELEKARRELAREVEFHTFTQFLFRRHFTEVKKEAGARGIRLMGDLPIFVAYNSADVWAHPELFHLDKQGRPLVVAGVPPDYFSRTGQLWGNPLYRFDEMAKDGYAWWANRLKMALTLYDMIRIDHFRGFEAYWEVPADHETAVEGRWVKGPGMPFFNALTKHLGPLPIVAEDLGTITPEVLQLREACNFPGMKVLQFAFGDTPDNPYLPHNYPPNSVVYTGTHDNDTTSGWWSSTNEAQRHMVRRYLARGGNDIVWDFIRTALNSVAALAILPLQDILNLGTAARLNTPGQATGNWTWRYNPDDLTPEIIHRLADLTVLYGRSVH